MTDSNLMEANCEHGTVWYDCQECPSFRVPMSNIEALRAMHVVVDGVVKAALDARVSLLNTGFADSHRLCVELDETAQQYAIALEVIRQQTSDELAE